MNIPIAAGENEYTARGFKDLIALRGVDFIQPSVFKLGGILQEKKVFGLAEAFGAKVIPHCWSFGPAMAATLHIAFSEPTCSLVETAVEILDVPLLIDPLVPDKGVWKVPDKPGLGVELNEDVLIEQAQG